MITQTTPFGFSVTVQGEYEPTVAAVRAALQQEGFGVLTEIDIRATLKAKLDVDLPPHIILGACNPPLAHKAITAQPEIGLLLPCNVVVRDGGNGTMIVSAMDPVAALSLAQDPGIEPIALEVRARLERALQSLAA
jgi:uncharacterized protein (DUF302 family)